MTLKKIIQYILEKVLPRKIYVSICYKHYTGKKYDFNRIQTFTQERWWLKYYYKQYKRELIELCYDKYTVRDYVKDKVGEEYLTEIYGVYNSVNDINFDKLPEKFVLKVTQSNGYNLICENKDKFDIELAKAKLDSWLKKSRKAHFSPETNYYFNGNAKIICERYLETKEGKIPNDLKIFCFNGIPRFTYVTFDPIDENGNMTHDYMINLYDIDWNYIPVQYGQHPTDGNIKFNKPKNYDKMLKVAKKLAEDFIFVRVDLYNIDGIIYFGELTWVPSSDGLKFIPEKYDEVFGAMLKLPNVKVF